MSQEYFDKSKKDNKVEKREQQKIYLFIDDNANILNSLKLFFEKENVFFTECHSAQEALAAISRYQPDVVLIDNSFSEENKNDGLEVIDALKDSNIKFYSITATSNKEVLGEYQKRGIRVLGKSNINEIKKILEE